MREILDILGRKIEVGDIVLRPIFSRLTRVYVLGQTQSSIIISRCIVNGTYCKYTKITTDLSEHNSKQYLSGYNIPDLYIIEKNAIVPENLKQFIKY